ncbi:hypothetical protein BDZ89DRAFT_1079035, partial [Hymenopellis radicata]
MVLKYSSGGDLNSIVMFPFSSNTEILLYVRLDTLASFARRRGSSPRRCHHLGA